MLLQPLPLPLHWNTLPYHRLWFYITLLLELLLIFWVMFPNYGSTFCPFWVHFSLFGQFQSKLVYFGLFRSNLVDYGPLWSIQSNFIHFNPIWSIQSTSVLFIHFGLTLSIQSSLVQFSLFKSIWSTLVHLVHLKMRKDRLWFFFFILGLGLKVLSIIE